MIQAVIKVEGKYYVGEDPDESEKVEKGGLTSGFYPNNNREVNKLLWSNNREDAHEAWGARGIKSILDRLEQRERMGILPKNFEFTIEKA